MNGVKKTILKDFLVPLGEESAERVQWCEGCCPHRHLLLSQSVLSSFLGTENDNNIVTYKEIFDHKLSPFLCQMKSAVIALDKSDFLGGGKNSCCLFQSDVRM